MFRKILVGVDGSPAARHALEQALELARLVGGQVTALSVGEKLPAYAATVGEMDDEQAFKGEYFRKILDDARRLAAEKGVTLNTHVVVGHPAEHLVRAAKEGGHSLIVIGHTGHSRIHNLLLGSTADRVVEHAPCPVLVTR
jgi:nucleotide-binding universal stress UspA family protein